MLTVFTVLGQAGNMGRRNQPQRPPIVESVAVHLVVVAAIALVAVPMLIATQVDDGVFLLIACLHVAVGVGVERYVSSMQSLKADPIILPRRKGVTLALVWWVGALAWFAAGIA